MFTNFPTSSTTISTPKLLCSGYTGVPSPSLGLSHYKPSMYNSTIGNANQPIYIKNGHVAACNRMPVTEVIDAPTSYRAYGIAGVNAGASEMDAAYLSHRYDEDGNDMGACSMRNGMVWTFPSVTRSDTRPGLETLAPYVIAPALTSYSKGFDYYTPDGQDNYTNINQDIFSIVKNVSDRLAVLEREVGIH